MNEIANDRFVVVSNGTGWGCISEFGEDIMMACMNETSPMNMTAVSTMKNCR